MERGDIVVVSLENRGHVLRLVLAVDDLAELVAADTFPVHPPVVHDEPDQSELIRIQELVKGVGLRGDVVHDALHALAIGGVILLAEDGME
jgi:hypothetical protein